MFKNLQFNATKKAATQSPIFTNLIHCILISIFNQYFNHFDLKPSRSKGLSFLTAFGMIQFPGTATSAAPQFTPVIPPQVFAQETVSDALNSHSRSGGRKDHLHSHHASSSSSSSRLQHQNYHRHHQPQHSSTLAAAATAYSGANASGVGGGGGLEFLDGGTSSSSGGSATSLGGIHTFVPVIYVGGQRVPDQMPLYQAIREFSTDVHERSRQLLEDHRFSMTEQNREDRVSCFFSNTRNLV